MTGYYAVLVGIADYPGTTFDKGVGYCINDIVDVKNALIQVGNWSEDNMWILKDKEATESNIQAKIIVFCKTL